MNAGDDLDAYFAHNIPLTRAMSVQVLDADPNGVRLFAPLAPNSNHKGTAFGGSIASLATLASWGLVYVRLAQAGIDAGIVIQRSLIDYLMPVTGDFEAVSAPGPQPAWDKALRVLERRGRARLTLAGKVRSDGAIAAEFEGVFVIERPND